MQIAQLNGDGIDNGVNHGADHSVLQNGKSRKRKWMRMRMTRTVRRTTRGDKDESKEQKNGDENNGDDDRGGDNDYDEEDYESLKPLIVVEIAWLEPTEKLRHDLIQYCVRMEAPGTWVVGFKVEVSCHTARQNPSRGTNIMPGEKEGSGNYPKNFTQFRYYLTSRQTGNYRYYDCSFIAEWTITKEKKGNAEDIHIPLEGHDPLVINADARVGNGLRNGHTICTFHPGFSSVT
ncbi:hypothetical protein IW262DRAFT_1325256 [Armillaria fumosa]|nr:hypothetical protein IW262DRAFT_1325256 [Armillaria fumosa]